VWRGSSAIIDMMCTHIGSSICAAAAAVPWSYFRTLQAVMDLPRNALAVAGLGNKNDAPFLAIFIFQR
jgi:hypothetical protein